jgi:alanine dehydrogenase
VIRTGKQVESMSQDHRAKLLVLTNEEVSAFVTPELAVQTMRDALRDHGQGELTSPPRMRVHVGDREIVFTVGGRNGRFFGYRSSDTRGSDQLVAVYESQTSRLQGIVVGTELFRRRTAALGAVAVDMFARPEATSLGIIGSGNEAWGHLWAVRTVRHIQSVRVYSRRRSRREAFARRCTTELGIPAEACETARTALEAADMVLLATSSKKPVVEPEWIPDRAHVTTLGPKTQKAHEAPVALAERAHSLTTDSLAQLSAYEAPFFLAGTPAMDRMTALGAVVAGRAPGRQSAQDLTMFCSVGLAGTEVALASALLAAVRT